MKTFILTTALCVYCLLAVNTYSQSWSNVQNGFDSVVQVLYTDTINNILYAGGLFKKTGNDTVNHIAKWNGTQWSNLGKGVADSSFVEVNAICIYNNELYIAGHFKYAGDSIVNNIAKWDGIKWSSLGVGIQPTGGVFSLAVYNNELYVGGVFAEAGGSYLSACIAKWNGVNWSAVGSGVGSGQIYSMAVYNGELYVGGDFMSAGGIGSFGIGRWNGTSWSDVSHGIASSIFWVNTLKVYKGELYLGGMFDYFDSGVIASGIAKWDGVNYYNVGAGATVYEVNNIAVLNEYLYIVGGFDTAGGVRAKYIARYNGDKWCGLGNIFVDNNSDPFQLITSYNNTIYTGGYFFSINGVPVNNIAKWIGGNYVDTCGISNIVSINNQNPEIDIYPNPVTNILFINGEQIIEIQISNIIGQRIKQFSNSQKQKELEINISDLKNGIYLISVFTSKGNYNQKIFKE